MFSSSWQQRGRLLRMRHGCWTPWWHLSVCLDSLTRGTRKDKMPQRKSGTLPCLEKKQTNKHWLSFPYPLWINVSTRRICCVFLQFEEVSHCRRKASRCILIRRQRTSAHWHYSQTLEHFFFFFLLSSSFLTALRCRARVRRRRRGESGGTLKPSCFHPHSCLFFFFSTNGAACLGKMIEFIVVRLTLVLWMQRSTWSSSVAHAVPVPPRGCNSFFRAAAERITRLCWEVGSSFMTFSEGSFEISGLCGFVNACKRLIFILSYSNSGHDVLRLIIKVAMWHFLCLTCVGHDLSL